MKLIEWFRVMVREERDYIKERDERQAERELRAELYRQGINPDD